MPPVKVFDVADYILDKVLDGREIDAVKLQKLLYFCQGWSYALLGEALFEEDFEAWAYGPVVREVYRPFARQIRIPAGKRFNGNPGALSAPQRKVVDAVIKDYGNLDSFALVDLTHEPGTPWEKYIVARGQQPQIVAREDIRDYFVAKLKSMRQTDRLAS